MSLEAVNLFATIPGLSGPAGLALMTEALVQDGLPSQTYENSWAAAFFGC